MNFGSTKLTLSFIWFLLLKDLVIFAFSSSNSSGFLISALLYFEFLLLDLFEEFLLIFLGSKFDLIGYFNSSKLVGLFTNFFGF